ncbi:mitochondrial antiviral-signaling protein [Astyanax mexicanus]|uniref:mitochondrial antiviral-signaling protein n=1 Tax=Astyanax mexicanus TaxID=7994 RepID=UPI0020CADEBA|nr:mitochondrial antiviral-signaling protein [Astyanax mexicanus]
MTFASDKLYKDFIQKMLSRLASTIKVREIIPHLHCLTLTDREEIEAKREVAGNYNAMQVLMDCLRRRENWPEQFIRALNEIDQQSLANEISDAYDKIRGIKPQRSTPPAAAAAAAASGPTPAASVVSPPAPAHVPAPAAATPPPAPSPAPALVTTATIHNVPRSTPPLLTPSPEEPPAPPAASAPAQSPPESLPRVDAPGPAEASVSVSAPEAPAPSPPKPAQPVKPSPPISAPPALPPSVVSAPQVTTSLQQNQVSFRPEATTCLDSSSDLTLSAISEPSSAAATSLPTSIIATSPFQLDTPDTSSQPPSSPEESKTPLGVTETSASVKHPIQDTSPPQKVAVLTQDVSSTVSQRMETSRSTVPPNSQASASSPGMAQVLRSASPPAVESVEYFSKPGILMGAEPSLASSDDLQISRPPTESAGSSPLQPARPAPVSSHLQHRQQLQEPCSVTSDQLMLSNSTTSTAGSSVSQPPTVSPENLVPNSTPEENSFSEQAVSSSENQPVEDTYESFCQSLQGEPVTMVHVGQINEEPSILNGQPPIMMGNAAHANEIQSTLNHNRPTESPPQSVITQTTQRNKVYTNEQAGACPKPSTPACQVSELNASGQPEQSEEAQRAVLLSDPRFIAATAAVGVAAAAFMAWKLKH